MPRVAILGGTGYGGMELLRLLLDHGEAEVALETLAGSCDVLRWARVRSQGRIPEPRS